MNLSNSGFNNSLDNNNSLVFIDSNLDNHQSLVSAVSTTENTEVILLDSTRDGVEQITETLVSYSELESIHIISHGQAGTLQLGSTNLQAENLNDYSSALEGWSNSLSDDADILLYGCEIGATLEGVDFLTNFGQLTKADLAASEDLTGSIELGGDWDLEVATGKIEVDSIYTQGFDTYEAILPIANENGAGSGDSDIDFDSFDNTSDLVFNGDASGQDGVLRLTSDAKIQSGSVFHDTAEIIDADTSFSAQFQFQISGGANGADGFTFMLHNDLRELGAVGEIGGGLGYQGINKSLAIEFDSYQNSQWDNNDNHISVLTNGNVGANLATASAPVDLNGGGLLNAWIDYNGQSDLLEVYLGETLSRPDTALLSLEVDLAATVGDRAFMGFSAATGGLSNNHDILSWEVDWNDNSSVNNDEQNSNSLLDFNNFSNLDLLKLNGNAAQVNNALRLTSANRLQAGTVFYDEPIQVNDGTSFSTQFQFQIGGGANGADGFTFMLQNDLAGDNALGRNGSGLGYQGIAQSVAIEFDTYQNKGEFNNNHLSILANGNPNNVLATVDAGFNLNGGQVLEAWIDYDGTGDLLEVFLSDTNVKPENAALFATIDLAATVGDLAFMGFSAATGGLSNNHDILSWEVDWNTDLPVDGGEVETPVVTPESEDLNTLVELDNFSNLDLLKLNGNAAQVNNALRLTPANRLQAGTVFYDEPIQVNDETSFSTQFQFQIGGGANGADGFTFMLQNDIFGEKSVGFAGRGLGYEGIGQSIAIEFDTYQGVGDLNNNHLSILANGNVTDALATVDAGFDLNGGQALEAWIDYDGTNDLLEVFLSDTNVKPENAALFTTIDLAATVGDRARIGFSAATGGLDNNHDILNWSFASSDKLAPEGNFSLPIDWPSIAIHAGLTPDGKVLTYGLDSNSNLNGEDQVNTKFTIWDPALGTADNAFTVLDMTHPVDNAFCSGMILLPDGQMLIAGGSIQGDRDAGNDLVHLYNYRAGEVTMLDEGDDLLAARWYPTLTTLTDGSILLQGGRNAGETDGVFTPEIYTAGEGSTWLDGATSNQVYSNEGNQWWYPRSWVAPNGKVFGITGDDMYYLDPNGDGAIEVVGTFTGQNTGETSTAVMFGEGKILQLGGRGNNDATIIDINGETPVLSSGGTTNHVRMWGDSTVLPDGTVFVSGGSALYNQLVGVAYSAEIWDPQTNTWTVVDSGNSPRLYHSTSLLLPDGTVLTGGGTTEGLDDEALTNEIYTPAYLFNEDGNLAERPTIESENKLIDWNESITATVGNGNKIDRVTLVSFGAVTHSFDMGQRFLELDFTQSGGELTIDTPESANVAPPGFYMMFAVDENGVPSEAQIFQIAPEGVEVDEILVEGTMDHSAHNGMGMDDMGMNHDGMGMDDMGMNHDGMGM